MTAWIQRWTPKFEFSIITAIAFIMPFIGSLLILINQNQSSFFSDHRLFRTIIFETIILLVIGFILYVRDFDVRHLHLNPSWRLTAQGVLLYLVTALASGVTAMIVAYLYPAAGSYLSSLRHGNQNIVTTLSLSIINPLYEELLLVGYVIATLDKFTSTTRAMVTSVSIRAICLLSRSCRSSWCCRDGNYFRIFFYTKTTAMASYCCSWYLGFSWAYGSNKNVK